MYEELLARTSRALTANDVGYAVMGGQAVLVHGEPRLTRDIDITLSLTTDERHRMDKVLEEANLRSIAPSEEFTLETFVLPCIDESSEVRVDFIFSLSDFEREAIERSIVVEVEGTPVHFVTAEDLVIHKLVAGRPRDIEDVQAVISRSEKLDLDYIRNWLMQFEEIVDHNPIAIFDDLMSD